MRNRHFSAGETPIKTGKTERGSWLMFPSGEIIQWGYIRESRSATDWIYFPIKFPNAVESVNLTCETHTGSPLTVAAVAYGIVAYNTDKEKFIATIGSDLFTGYSSPTIFFVAFGR